MIRPDGLRGPFRGRLARYEMHELSLREPSRGIPIASGCFMFLRSALFAYVIHLQLTVRDCHLSQLLNFLFLRR